MAVRSNIALARTLAGGTGLGVSEFADIEATQEREQELQRALAAQNRAERAAKQSSKGRLFGGILGGVVGSGLLKVATGLLAGATGGLGVLALTALTKGAPLIRALASSTGGRVGARRATRDISKERLQAIDVGSFRVAQGRERETEFRAAEDAFRTDLSRSIDAGAISDFQSALAFQSLLPGLFGGNQDAGIGFRVDQSLGQNLPGPFLPKNLSELSDIDRKGLFSILESMIQGG